MTWLALGKSECTLGTVGRERGWRATRSGLRSGTVEDDEDYSDFAGAECAGFSANLCNTKIAKDDSDCTGETKKNRAASRYSKFGYLGMIDISSYFANEAGAPSASNLSTKSLRGSCVAQNGGRLFGRARLRRAKCRKYFAIIAAFFYLGASDVASAQTPRDRVDAILRRAMQDRRIPGLQVAVVVNGKVALSRSYGLANLQTPVPVTATTIFTLNSITKAFTGIAAMREVEKGRLDLSAPISRYLDDIPASWGSVTVRQLFGQMSGLPDIYAYGNSELFGLIDEDKAWAWALTQPVAQPGEKEIYDQTNLALAQRIINRLNGRSPDSSVVAEQLSKAGMVQTVFGDSRDVILNKSQPYSFLNAEGKLHNRYEQFGPMLHAGSGLNSTANDMARWMISILNGKQLGEKARATLWTPVRFNDGTESDWGIGWDINQRRNFRAVGMTGGGRSAFFLYPEYKVAVVILTNLLGSNPEDLTDEIAAAFDPRIKLAGVEKLRAAAETTNFADLTALLSAAEANDAVHEINQDELEHWIKGLLWSGSLKRALELAKFDLKIFPTSTSALSLLRRAYEANGLKADSIRVSGAQ